MQVAAVAAKRLDGVAEGVAEVEQGARALLLLVLGHDPRLDLAGAFDRVQQGLRVAGKQGIHVCFKPRKERRVGDHAVLHDLRDAGGEFACRQGAQHADIRHHRARLMERADQVLAIGMVHGRFATDRRIHQGQQRGRNLHQADAALVGRRGESRHVADHAAAEGHHGGGAVVPLHHQFIEDLGVGGEGLVLLAVADLDHVDLPLFLLAQALEQCRQQ